MPPPLRHVLFDFGDTLARQPFFVNPPPGVVAWADAVLATYEEDGFIDRWCLGEVTLADVAQRVAARAGTTAAAARDAMEADCGRLRLNENVVAFAREMGRVGRAAVVTVNPDVFTDQMVPALRLDRDFPVIVASWKEGTLDKVALCETALVALGRSATVESTLLVDNDPASVVRWWGRGGQGYHFTDDDVFAADLADLRADLA
jgi:hypothetical protein